MKNICVYGDSLVYGMGDTTEGGWVTRLENKLNNPELKFWNFGIPGDTSQDLLNRLEEDIKTKKPDMALVFIGANDTQYNNIKEKTLISPTDYRQNLEKILKIIKQHTKEVIFIGLPRMDDKITTTWHYLHFCNENLAKYDGVIKKFCEENNLKYISLSDTIDISDLSDGAHPNAQGYQKITDKIEQGLDF